MSDWAMVALTGIYVVATIFISVFNYRTAKATKEQITEIKRQYETENRPYSGGGNGCLIDGLFGCIKYLLYGVLILIGVGVIGVVLLLTKIFG